MTGKFVLIVLELLAVGGCEILIDDGVVARAGFASTVAADHDFTLWSGLHLLVDRVERNGGSNFAGK
jgi:hypothetical protein